MYHAFHDIFNTLLHLIRLKKKKKKEIEMKKVPNFRYLFLLLKLLLPKRDPYN